MNLNAATSGETTAGYTKEKYEKQANSLSYQLNLLLRSVYYKHFCLRDLQQSLLDTLNTPTALGDIIDIGGGTGAKAQHLLNVLSLENRFILTDISANMIEQARITLAKKQHLHSIDYHCANLITDPEVQLCDLSKNIGGIICNQVLHHYSNHEKTYFYQKAFESLNPGGFLAITSSYTPETGTTISAQLSSELFNIFTRSYKGMLGRTDYTFTTISETIKSLQEIGFSIDEKNSKKYNIAGIQTLMGFSPYNQIVAYKKN